MGRIKHNINFKKNAITLSKRKIDRFKLLDFIGIAYMADFEMDKAILKRL